MHNAENCSLNICGTEMDYISFSSGEQTLVMLPGLGDALKTVKGSAVSFSMLYRIFARDFKVFVFSRKNRLPSEYSISD